MSDISSITDVNGNTYTLKDATARSGLANAVTGPSSSTDAHVAVFNGATGKALADSGYTIGTSVPSNAVFTDTTYSAGTGLSLSSTTINHSNSITAQTTQAVYPIKIDAQGHITGYGSAQTILTLGTTSTTAAKGNHTHSGYAPTQNPVFTGTISLGRASGSTSGTNSVVFGTGCTGSGNYSHVLGGSCEASGTYSHAEGCYCIANHNSQHVFGRYNVVDPSENAATNFGDFVEIVGNGATALSRSNARTLDWNGNERLKGDLYVGANSDGTGGTKVIKRGCTWGDLLGT